MPNMSCMVGLTAAVELYCMQVAAAVELTETCFCSVTP